MSSNCVSINTFRKMEDLLQSQIKKSCNLAIPNGLKELMWDISREVLRSQPQDVYNFITKYLSVMLVTRENLTVAAKVCDETCHAPCQRALEDKLRDIGLKDEDVDTAKEIIMEHLKGAVKVSNLLLKLMRETNIDETMLPEVQEAIRSAFVQHHIHKAVVFEAKPEDEVMDAVNHTLRLYENTSPTTEEYNRMARKIQAAYRAYGVRRELCVKRNENREKYSEIKDKTLRIKDHVHVEIKEPEITKSPQSNIRSSITTNSSTSLAGSYITLPKYTPYSAHDIYASVFEEEHYNADFIEDIKYDEQVSIHGEKKKEGKRRISFETLTIEDSFVADDESESSIEELIHAEDDNNVSETSETNEEIAEICDIDGMENINEICAITENSDENLTVI